MAGTPVEVKVAAFLAVFSIVIPAVFFGYFKKDTEKTTARFTNWIAAVKTLDDTDSVYYVVTDDIEDYFLSRYLATPVRSSGWHEGGSYSEGRSGWIYTGDPFTFDMTLDELKDAVKVYDYFFLDDATDEFVAKYGSLFEGEVKAQVLYRVVKDGDDVSLVLYRENF